MKLDNFQVYGLGQCPLDYLGKIASYPKPDTKCIFTDLSIQGGGPTATALVALARWGVSCTFAGIVGDDAFGKEIRTSLEKQGVDTCGMLVRKGSDSQFAFIVAEPTTATRTIFWRQPTGHPPKPGELDYRLIQKAKVIHTDGLFKEASLAACKKAKEAGRCVVVDGGTLRDGMLELVPFSDYYVVSQAFSDAFSGPENHAETCRRLADLGSPVTGVTLGKKGYIALIRGRFIEKQAYPVEALDTTGCGDAFHAGLTFGALQGWDPEKSLDFGAWAAAKVSEKLGGRAGIPSLSAVQKRGFL
jgi:ribokinase